MRPPAAEPLRRSKREINGAGFSARLIIISREQPPWILHLDSRRILWRELPKLQTPGAFEGRKRARQCSSPRGSRRERSRGSFERSETCGAHKTGGRLGRCAASPRPRALGGGRQSYQLGRPDCFKNWVQLLFDPRPMMRLSQVGSRISSSSHYVRADRATLGECAETRTRYYTHFGRTPWWGVEFQANFLPGLWASCWVCATTWFLRGQLPAHSRNRACQSGRCSLGRGRATLTNNFTPRSFSRTSRNCRSIFGLASSLHALLPVNTVSRFVSTRRPWDRQRPLRIAVWAYAGDSLTCAFQRGNARLFMADSLRHVWSTTRSC